MYPCPYIWSISYGNNSYLSILSSTSSIRIYLKRMSSLEWNQSIEQKETDQNFRNPAIEFIFFYSSDLELYRTDPLYTIK